VPTRCTNLRASEFFGLKTPLGLVPFLTRRDGVMPIDGANVDPLCAQPGSVLVLLKQRSPAISSTVTSRFSVWTAKGVVKSTAEAPAFDPCTVTTVARGR